MTTTTKNSFAKNRAQRREARKLKAKPWWFKLAISPMRRFLWAFRGDLDLVPNLALEVLITVAQMMTALLTIQTIYVMFSGVTIAANGFAMLPIYEGVDPSRLVPSGLLEFVPEMLASHSSLGVVLSKMLVSVPGLRLLFVPAANGGVWETSARAFAFMFAYGAGALWSWGQGALTRPLSEDYLNKMIAGTSGLKKVKPEPGTLAIHRAWCHKKNSRGNGLALLMRFGWLLTFGVEAAAVVLGVTTSTSASIAVSLVFWGLVQAGAFELLEYFRRSLINATNGGVK